MKISVSNIAWPNNELDEHLALLKDLGCDGVEIAPSCIWKEPIDTSQKNIEALKKKVSGKGLEISALHALLFTRPDLGLFKERSVRDKTVLYLKGLVRIAGRLSVKVLVYGSPKSRELAGRPLDECRRIAVDVFRELAKEAALNNTCFCIEPLGKDECEFINSADEAVSLIREVGEPYFGLHLDAKAMMSQKEDFKRVFDKYASILRHFHVGDAGLAPPGYTGADHLNIGLSLSRSSYKGYVSIEMRRGFGETRDVVKKAVEYVRDKYNIR